MMTLKVNKVPGLDGLTIEFYRKFWKSLALELNNMYQYCYEVRTPRSLDIGPSRLFQGNSKAFVGQHHHITTYFDILLLQNVTFERTSV